MPLPLVPCVIIANQISHEVAYVDSLGRIRVKDRASDRWSVHLVRGDLVSINQISRTNRSPFDRSVILANPGAQIISSLLVVHVMSAPRLVSVRGGEMVSSASTISASDGPRPFKLLRHRSNHHEMVIVEHPLLCEAWTSR